jgi:hypothetical protein
MLQLEISKELAGTLPGSNRLLPGLCSQGFWRNRLRTPTRSLGCISFQSIRTAKPEQEPSKAAPARVPAMETGVGRFQRETSFFPGKVADRPIWDWHLPQARLFATLFGLRAQH